jgi:formylglycine-generating enzyme required for sulfatase activity
VRLHNRHDFVRYEVETALRRKIRLVPVLIDNTPPPLEEHLPVELHPLLRRQGLELDFRRHTEAALNRLVEISRKALSVPVAPPPVSQPTWSEFKVGNVVQRMRWIEPGTFWMGSPDDEPERRSEETRHRVTLTRGYWIADTACTQALWQEVMGSNPSQFKDDPQNPVECVSWNDVTELFLPKLNERVPGLNLVLPTEAQWENACRAGTTTPFSFGDQITPEQVNYDGNYPYNGGKKGRYREKTVPVKALPANQWGLYQMHGNVLEWCADGYGDYPPGEAKDPVVHQDKKESRQRVLRGGSRFLNGRDCRSASRYAAVPDVRYYGIGLRLARGLAD